MQQGNTTRFNRTWRLRMAPLAELAKAASPAQRSRVANAVFHSTEKRVRDPTDNSRQTALSSHLRVGRVCLSGSARVGPGPDIDIGDTFLHRLQSKSDFPYCVVQGWNRELRSKAQGKRHQNHLRAQMHCRDLIDLNDSRVGR